MLFRCCIDNQKMSDDFVAGNQVEFLLPDEADFFCDRVRIRGHGGNDFRDGVARESCGNLGGTP